MPRHATLTGDARPNTGDLRFIQAQAHLLRAQRRAAEVYGPGGDPWLFVKDLVWTRDEAVTGRKDLAVTRRYPDKPYAELLTRRWQEHDVFAIAKSRRMVVSWLFVALNCWLAITQPLSRIAFMARKEGKTKAEGSAELVARADFILSHLPPIFPPDLFVPGSQEHSHCYLKLPNGSEILGLGQGADQARQLTFTSVLCDEVSFWEQAYETWQGLRPTIQGGGKITLVSSAGLGFFKDLVHDQLK